MESNLRLACAQINCTVGDLEGNCKKIIEYIQKAEKLGVDIISFPELTITGYPPEDLLLKPKFIKDNLEKLKKLARNVFDIVTVVGFVDRQSKNIYNSVAIIYNREIKGIYHKMFLPNYGVFDEMRYFKQGTTPFVFKFGRVIFGANICEDIWHKDGPTRLQSLSGASLILNISASPYYVGKVKERENIIKNQAKDNSVFIAYTNLVGGQDELVFDGQSLVVDSNGKIIARAEAFKEDLLIVDLNISAIKTKLTEKTIMIVDKVLSLSKKPPIPPIPKKQIKSLEPINEIYQGLILGLKDYVIKNGFQKVVIGLSGGIDSSLVATLAVDALGKDNVIGIFMPSKYNSQQSKIDAELLAKNLGIKFITVPIDSILKVYLITLDEEFIGTEKDITEENLQARIRGNILMAFSNKFGYLVLTTGNKSEMACGYATLYGDMAGGFAPLKDLLKTFVYKIAEWRNKIKSVIPENVFIKAPTAELKENQKDEDILPPYNLLDKILHYYIEEDKSIEEIISSGFDKKIVLKVINMVDKTEYKRRQSPPGIKITHKAFGKDRRMPITNKYRINVQ